MLQMKFIEDRADLQLMRRGVLQLLADAVIVDQRGYPFFYEM
jgi:hypothetical protein